MSTPKLRFPEFNVSGTWAEYSLENFATFYKGKGVSKVDIDIKGKTPCIRYGELYTHYSEVINTVISRTNLPENELFFSKSNDVIIPASGETKWDIAKASCVMLDDVALGGDLNVIRTNQNGVFISYYLNGAKKYEISKIAQGDSVVHLYSSQLKLINLFLPPKPEEQQKIADCLSSLDDLITAQNQKVEALKQHKKGLMQQLFPDSPPAKGEYTEGGRGLIPKLRFPEFENDGEWQFIPLNKIAKRCTQKNRNEQITRVLTNSAEFGVVDQRDFFDKDIATQGNLEGYYIVEEGHYVYNPRISSFAPVGPISKNKIGLGVMSPLYTVFRFDKEQNDFYSLFFKSTGWHHYMRQASSTGARHDRMAISNEAFMDMPIPVTSSREQQKNANFLSSIDELISTETQQLEAYKAHKKGLMQQLFPALDDCNT